MTEGYYARGVAAAYGPSRSTASLDPELSRSDSWPAWFADVTACLEELSGLPANWDSYGAPEISAEVIRAALDTLLAVVQHDTPRPQVVPTASGGVQFEWDEPTLEAELEFADSTTAHWWCCEPGTGGEVEREFRLAYLAPIRKELTRLTGEPV